MKNKVLKPVTEKQRYHCPFYGFYMAPGLLLDQSGNQCALITSSYSPCQMQINNQIPDWDECMFNNPANEEKLEKIANNFKIFPEEFNPKKENSWKGISFKDWQKYILKKQTS